MTTQFKKEFFASLTLALQNANLVLEDKTGKLKIKDADAIVSLDVTFSNLSKRSRMPKSEMKLLYGSPPFGISSLLMSTLSGKILPPFFAFPGKVYGEITSLFDGPNYMWSMKHDGTYDYHSFGEMIKSLRKTMDEIVGKDSPFVLILERTEFVDDKDAMDEALDGFHIHLVTVPKQHVQALNPSALLSNQWKPYVEKALDDRHLDEEPSFLLTLEGGKTVFNAYSKFEQRTLGIKAAWQESGIIVDGIENKQLKTSETELSSKKKNSSRNQEPEDGPIVKRKKTSKSTDNGDQYTSTRVTRSKSKKLSN